MIDHPPAIIEVLSDHGGSLGERQIIVGWLKRSGIHIAIKGVCVSSCVWFLRLPKDQVCAYPTARIGNHTDLGGPNDSIKWISGEKLIALGVIAACQSFDHDAVMTHRE